jgi:hypothetical protein
MEQRDHLQKQLDLIGKVLGKLMGILIGMKTQDKSNEGMEITQQTLKEELNIDFEEWIALPTVEFHEKLQQSKFNEDNLRALADIFSLLADKTLKNELRALLYQKCLSLYQYLEKTETTLSMEQHLKVKRIMGKLSEL